MTTAASKKFEISLSDNLSTGYLVLRYYDYNIYKAYIQEINLLKIFAKAPISAGIIKHRPVIDIFTG